MKIYCFYFIVLSVLFFSCSPKPKPFPNQGLNNLADSMEFVLQKNQFYIEAPKHGEWLERNKERGQTFTEYWNKNSNIQPVQTTEKRKKIYLQLHGDFDETQLRLMDSVQRFLSVFYELPIERLEQKKLDSTQLNALNWRLHKRNGFQVKTGFILDSLENNLPKDGVLLVGFTTNDLYPSQKWSFVFGQARLYDRVGIWSMARFGDKELIKNDADIFNLTLERTCKTAVHEIGHIFSIQHCTFYRCAMQGANNLTELDGHPSYFCPVCDAKIISNLHLSLSKRYENLAAFWKNQQQLKTSNYYKKTAIQMKRLEE
ncbi:putative Zn-dependent protease [Bernardetia litoralis DSM 6794]|uniref:Putative Zn-dependent protease n=1 Tax=Bernardetia litoralis (strain ATCC 23117 / DSM 6794 / NBRC 15988 / NCIMB 1366 / Fx l1 / Sio-4) TaxID=880071 RepID=I4ANA3_BERLS|nr:archaemetzincin [Bernardetia litoralis]AFM05438.1 putative Zn-dependent protease [Bernardetia litoralis DSM 6794]